MQLSVEVIIALQTALLIFLQFGDKALPSLFAARKACHAGSGALMLLLDSRDPIARFYMQQPVAALAPLFFADPVYFHGWR
eukprot:Skav235645  [mRNA]  locus=scaffold358:583803:588065:- [translate_table: standard]